MRRLRYRHPPRPLHTDLPRQFCFREAPEAPSFLRRRRRVRRRLERHPDLRFLELNFDRVGRWTALAGAAGDGYKGKPAAAPRDRPHTIPTTPAAGSIK